MRSASARSRRSTARTSTICASAWTWSLPNGPNQSTPLVHDGVLFVHGYGDKVQALDAATGDLLWQYSRRLPTGVAPSVKRGISIYGTRLYVPTSDAHIVALDMKTGKRGLGPGRRRSEGRLRHDRRHARGARQGHGRHDRAAPRVATTSPRSMRKPARKPGGSIPSRGRTSPAARAGTAMPLEKRNGGSVWIPGSYDPVQNLAFFAPGNTYDTGPLRNPVNQPGVTNDALYLDSTLAWIPTPASSPGIFSIRRTASGISTGRSNGR